jgi:hypothetical protein
MAMVNAELPLSSMALGLMPLAKAFLTALTSLNFTSRKKLSTLYCWACGNVDPGVWAMVNGLVKKPANEITDIKQHVAIFLYIQV